MEQIHKFSLLLINMGMQLLHLHHRSDTCDDTEHGYLALLAAKQSFATLTLW